MGPPEGIVLYHVEIFRIDRVWYLSRLYHDKTEPWTIMGTVFLHFTVQIRNIKNTRRWLLSSTAPHPPTVR
jgi:hypothetical protein